MSTFDDFLAAIEPQRANIPVVTQEIGVSLFFAPLCLCLVSSLTALLPHVSHCRASSPHKMFTVTPLRGRSIRQLTVLCLCTGCALAVCWLCAGYMDLRHSERPGQASRRREFCHFAGTPSP